MIRKLAAAVLALVFFGPAAGLIGIGVLMNPAAAYCASLTTGVALGTVPESLTVTTGRGETFTLNRTQLTHAATIISIGSSIDGVGGAGIKIALMAALTESTLRMLSNTGAYPESASYPNDGNGSDHDSLGLFQMRPQSGWGTVAELMDPSYQARAFYGGKTGPNYPSPRGLLDIPGWERMEPGEAAQAVEVSAYPDRYRNYGPVADTILATLTTASRTSFGTRSPLSSTATGDGRIAGCPSAGFYDNTGIAPPQKNPDGRWPAESCSLPDPTQPRRKGACVTPRTATIAKQIESMNVGHNGIACWDPHAWNPTSDHPKGRACDIVFGRLGHFPTGADKASGDRLAEWLVATADTWGVNYVIWQGRVWSSARASQGWRPYTGGGIYNPSDATGGHWDHIHLSQH